MEKKGKLVKIICDWCGKEKEMPSYEVNGKVFQACSNECKYNLQRDYMKKKWATLTPEQREEWKNNMVNSHTNNGSWLIEFHKTQRPEKVKKVIELMTSPIEKVVPNQRFSTRRDKKSKRGNDIKRFIKTNPRIDSEMPRGTCTLIAAHHEMLKHDPERLTTAFMEEICGVDCKCKVKKEEQT